MNALLENGCLKELKCGPNFAYIFQSSDDFAITQYKVLRNQTSAYLLPCVRTGYNGKTELYYLTGELKPFSSMLSALDSYAFRAVAAGLLKAVNQVKSIGFLSIENIDLSYDKIFFDTTTYQAALVYVPSKKPLFPDVASFENELRSGLVKLISEVTTFLTPRTMSLASDLANGTLSLEEVFQHISTGQDFAQETREATHHQEMRGDSEQERELKGTRSLVLRQIGGKEKLEIRVNNNPFIIGKSEEADGALTKNIYISKKHCQIVCRNGSYYISDLGSVNHTYINKKELTPNQDYPLHNGDIVRLANSEFEIILR